MNKVKKVTPEVLITGAGPTGLMMASRLAQFNVQFRIIDKKKSLSRFSGAMIVHARTLELLKQMGLAEKMVVQGTKISALNAWFNGKTSSRLNLTDKIGNLSEFPFILMLEQSKTENLLIEYLQKKGYNVEWETMLDDFNESQEHVEATLVLPDGKREVVRTDYLIAADGAKSSIRKALGIPFLGKTHNKNLSIIESDADINLAPGEICFSFSKQATIGFFPLSEGKWRIDAAFQKMKEKEEHLTFDKVQRVFNRKTKLQANIRNPDWFSVFHSHGKYANYYRVNRIFLVGDAAHLFTPVGGQGMNTGMQDACNLAWKLAMVLQRKVFPEVLDTYQEERKPVAISTCRASDRFFNLAASGNLQYRLFRNHMLHFLMKLFFRLLNYGWIAGYVFKKISGTGIAYSLNLVNTESDNRIYSAAPKPGQRFPFVQHHKQHKALTYLEKINDHHFHLIAFGDEKNLNKLEKAIRKHSGIINFLPIPFNAETCSLYLQFGIKSAGWFLIRPDLYIASRSDEYGAQALKAYLQKFFILK